MSIAEQRWIESGILGKTNTLQQFGLSTKEEAKRSKSRWIYSKTGTICKLTSSSIKLRTFQGVFFLHTGKTGTSRLLPSTDLRQPASRKKRSSRRCCATIHIGFAKKNAAVSVGEKIGSKFIGKTNNKWKTKGLQKRKHELLNLRCMTKTKACNEFFAKNVLGENILAVVGGAATYFYVFYLARISLELIVLISDENKRKVRTQCNWDHATMVTGSLVNWGKPADWGQQNIISQITQSNSTGSNLKHPKTNFRTITLHAVTK